jgi:hypothetical protein
MGKLALLLLSGALLLYVVIRYLERYKASNTLSKAEVGVASKAMILDEAHRFSR